MEHEESAGRNLGNSSPVVDEVIDVSDKEWTFPLLDQFTSMEAEAVNRVNGLYVYNNVFTLIPESVSQFKSMKTLKVFSNEVNLFSSEVGDLVELENLQVKVSSSGLGSLPPLQKLKTLKELELCKMPPRPSAFSLSSEISNLRSLTRLSVCHFSISTVYYGQYKCRGPGANTTGRVQWGRILSDEQVRCLEASGASQEQQKNFECNCLGEVRMLSALREHPCIIDLYGHRLSSSWVSSPDGRGERQILQFIIAMEYVKGGCLETLLNKLTEDGKNCTPAKLAMFIARDVACALVELHSKQIIHRDVKSKNILIDLEVKRSDESPLVKLCDFDRAVPLHSSAHTCCLAHHGVPLADVCVGTPRWMAPEMIQAMHRPHRYGLEVDLWSFGCLILELLTLQVPYALLSDIEVHHALQIERRPQLTPELDNFFSQAKDKVPARTEGLYSEEERKILKVLVELFYSCTESNPSHRPTAKQAYEMLSAVSGPTPRLGLN